MTAGEVLSIGTLVALVGQVVGAAYWGGRLAATLDALAHRVGRLEDALKPKT